MAAVLLAFGGCSQDDRSSTASTGPLGADVPVGDVSSPTDSDVGSTPQSSTTDSIGNGQPSGELPGSIQRQLLAEINALPTDATPRPVHADLASTVSALQRRFGLDETASLSASDVAVVQSVHGAGTLGESIALVKAELASRGYAAGGPGQTFDREMQLSLAALAHDAGRAPDATLSTTNLRLLDVAAGSAPDCASSPEPFVLPTAQAIVDHVEQFALRPRIVFIEPPVITGDPELDRRIATRATERGYEVRPAAGDLAFVDASIEVGAELAVAWDSLSSAASSDGITMFIASGFRSFELQRSIFVDRLTAVVGEPLTSERASASAIDEVLDSHAPPGFSKHQTGNAIDLAVPGSDLEQFRESEAFAWLAADNYQNARRFGFVPSYPAGVDGLGPQPEPWEWLWVGTEVLYRCEPIG